MFTMRIIYSVLPPSRKTKMRETNSNLIFICISCGLESAERVRYSFTFHQTDISNISLSTSYQSNVESHSLHSRYVWFNIAVCLSNISSCYLWKYKNVIAEFFFDLKYWLLIFVCTSIISLWWKTIYEFNPLKFTQIN